MSALTRYRQLKQQVPAVLPSMLLCDFGNLEREIRALEEAGAPGFHLDVMDGVFVPNFTYGMPIVAAFRALTELPLDVHLMIARPEQYVESFIEAGADLLSFHVEATEDAVGLVRTIARQDVAAGVAINPETPMESGFMSAVEAADFALVMSVQAGFGGQTFNPVALERLRALRASHPSLLLQVDGGINRETIGDCAAAGAQCFVVGSAIFRAESYQTALESLSRQLHQAPADPLDD